jgi:hypothetical protein
VPSQSRGAQRRSWYEVAAEQGNAEARKELAAISKELTPQQISDARAQAAKCKASKFEQCD